MANLQERRDKSGKLISYSIRVHRGRGTDGKQLKPWTATFDVQPGWSGRSAKKKAEAFAATFERDCKAGIITDSRKKFEEYAEYVISLKEKRNKAKHSTVERYRELAARIYPELGHMKLTDIQPAHLNNLYDKLGAEGVRKGGGRATAKIDLASMMKEKKITKTSIATGANLAQSTVAAAVTGKSVSIPTAQAVADALGLKLEKAFTVQEGGGSLSPKTVLEHHRLISVVLGQAEKEGLVPFNAAAKATPPCPEKKEPNYFQPETVYAILDAADKEPVKYRAFIYLCATTGARRGEVAALKWDRVDLTTGQVTIDRNLLYSRKKGVYEDSTKTKETRSLKIPQEVVAILKQVRREQTENRLKLGEYWQDTGYIFTQDNGQPMNPQTWTGWMDDFSKRHDLPHINPHAFRHTAASVMIARHVDDITVSGILGHSSADFTKKQYGHLIEEAKAAASDTITEVLLRKRA